MWSTEEDKVLVDCLVALKVDQKYMADNGFKSGFANALQSMMEEKLLGCGIKAPPHITSRIKTLKKLWQPLMTWYTGERFELWCDPHTKCVTADKDVWDEYVKSHSRAAQFRTKSFPNFESLSMVWGKDRGSSDEVLLFSWSEFKPSPIKTTVPKASVHSPFMYPSNRLFTPFPPISA
ncbi:hypothetical protein K1719_047171 [Acacia pycnantha]|nr:hypothetical protein K1719_047171 [Acacia pycnantha]